MPTDLHGALQRKAARKKEESGEWSLLLMVTLGLCLFSAAAPFESPAFATAIRWVGVN